MGSAFRGARRTDSGAEVIADPEKRQRVRAQANRLFFTSIIAAAVATCGVTFIP